MKRYETINVRVAVTGTTGAYIGRAARGGIVLPRNYYVEAARCCMNFGVTTTNLKFKMDIYKNATTVLASFINGSATKQCTTTGAKTLTGTVPAPTITTSNRLWFNITAHRANQTKINVTLTLREN